MDELLNCNCIQVSAVVCGIIIVHMSSTCSYKCHPIYTLYINVIGRTYKKQSECSYVKCLSVTLS